MNPPAHALRRLLAGLILCSCVSAVAVAGCFWGTPWARQIAIAASLSAALISFIMLRGLKARFQFFDHALTRLRDGSWEKDIPAEPGHELAPLYDGLNRLAKNWHDKQVLAEAFRRYIDPSLADYIVRQGLVLGGETFHATILFADMRDFTELSELMTPQEMLGLLNQYFTVVEPIIHQEGGWVNKFGGDSLLAIFGAPIVFPDHVERAVRACTRIRDAMTEFNIRQRQVGGPMMRVGMGIHCGEVVIGHVGGAKRMEYTVIGDTVNTASRIQALHRKYGKSILLSADAHRVVSNFYPSVSALPPLMVQGKSEPLQVYALD